MFSTINKDFMYLDDTVLLYKGTGNNITVPSKVDDHAITCIGSGAITANNNIETVRVEKGIREIASEGIGRNPRLQRIILPDSIESLADDAFLQSNVLSAIDVELELSKEDYETLESGTLGDKDGLKIFARGMGIDPATKVIDDGLIIYDRHGDHKIKPISYVNSGMRNIFIEGRPYSSLGKKSYNLTGGSSGITPEQDVRKKIRDAEEGSYYFEPDTDAENASDQFLRTHKKMEPVVFLPAFDKGLVRGVIGNYFLTLSFLVCSAYFYSVKPMVYQGKKYYLVFKNYLYGDPKAPYIRGWAPDCYNRDGSEADSVTANALREKNAFLTMI